MNETTQTVKEVIDVAITTLQPLAEKLNKTADYVWGLQIRQAHIDGVCYLVGLIIGIVFIWGAYTAYEQSKQAIDNEDKGSYIVLSVLLFIVGCCVCRAYLPSVLQCLFNPEYYALTQIINLAK